MLTIWQSGKQSSAITIPYNVRVTQQLGFDSSEYWKISMNVNRDLKKDKILQ